MKSNLKIFIVDNDLDCLNRYHENLQNLGYGNIQLFLSGSSCINSLYQKPALVFLNRDMDDKAGSAVLEKIKCYDPIISVVIISNKKNAKRSLDVLNYNICDYIIKGDDEVKKIETIANYIFTKKNKQEVNDQCLALC